MKKLLFISLTFLFLSCDNKLTTDEATKVISSNYPTFCTSSKIITSMNVFNSGYKTNEKYYPVFKRLEAQGVVHINKSNLPYGGDGLVHKIVLTDEYKEKYKNKLALTTNEFVEIIGISQKENEAIVKYKMKSVKTPLLGLQYGKERCYETEWEEEITLIKFDTGWQISKK